MTQTSYSDLEMDNIFVTSGHSWRSECYRVEKGRRYNFEIINLKTNEIVHVIKDMPSIVNGKVAAARYCVEKLGGRPRDLTHEQKSDIRVGDVEARLAQTEMELAALKKSAAPADDQPAAPKGKKKKAKAEEGGDPPSEQ